MNWQQAIAVCHQNAAPFAVATVLGTTGSTPRDAATKMVITRDDIHDTIGGGQLELQVIERARTLLESPVPAQQLDHFPLATRAGQCCGGSVTVLIESFPVTAIHLVLFGAGHVAQALMQVLAQCDARIDWVDSRETLFPASVPANVKLIPREDPVTYVSELNDHQRCIIVTHDHALDYALTLALLTETEIDYIGLIGSDTKAARFYDRLARDGVSPEDRARCRCPIGLPGVQGKLPMEIAVAIAAQILSLEPASPSQVKPDLTWKQIKAAFASQ